MSLLDSTQLSPEERVALIHRRCLIASPLLQGLMGDLRWSHIYSMLAPVDRGFSLITALGLICADDGVLTTDLLVHGKRSDTYSFLSDFYGDESLVAPVADGRPGYALRSNAVVDALREIIREREYFSHLTDAWGGVLGSRPFPEEMNFSRSFFSYPEVLKGASAADGESRLDALYERAAKHFHVHCSPSSTDASTTITAGLYGVITDMDGLKNAHVDSIAGALQTYSDVATPESTHNFAMNIFHAQEHFTPEKVEEFNSLVEEFNSLVDEYNLEWGVSAFSWTPPEGSQVIEALSSLVREMPWE